MLEKKLIEQLSQLKEIKPDADWKIRNRDILVKQIYGSQIEENASKNNWTWYWRVPMTLVSGVSQPAWVAILIFLFLVGGGATSVKMAERTKPGDPLYIAKLISERTQLALTFNDTSKARLGLQFASNRADEINQILAEQTTAGNNQNVASLLNNLKSQISDVRSSIAKISPTATPTNNVTGNKASGNNGQMVISADLKKENKGIELNDGSTATVSDQEPQKSMQSTTTNNNTVVATSSAAALNISQTADILKQAEQLLGQNKYSDTLTKLNEADRSILPKDSQPASGDGKNATSTVK
jgi:hypothetical protein